MMKLIEEVKSFYMLWHDEKTGDYILGVNCGTVAGYELKIRLTEAEKAEYLSEIRVLAEKVQYSPRSFFDRHITQRD